MTTKRLLPGALLVVFTACPAAAQYSVNPYPTTVPSAAPGGTVTVPLDPTQPPGAMPPGRPAAAAALDPTVVAVPYGRPTAAGPLDPTVVAVPYGRPASAGPLDRVSAVAQPMAPTDAAPFATLTGQPPVQPVAIPPGSYPGTGWTGGGNPWQALDFPACCGPFGRDGPIGYEVYTNTGPTIPFGAGPFVHLLEVGWMVGAGGRSLFFNQARDAAWVTDLGWSYEYNRGNQFYGLNLDTRQPQTTNSAGAVVNQPDLVQNLIVRDIERNSFNWAIGRDWWFWGPGATGTEQGWNLRIGGLIGGQYGTMHIDEVLSSNQFQYFRRQNVFEGFTAEFHVTLEVPVGGVIWFSGLQVQYVYDWTNIAPPVAGDIQNINVLLHTGFRF